MEEHVRVAVYAIKQGTGEELAALSHAGILPIFRSQPGFVRHGLAQLDDGTLAAITVWDSHAQAEAGNELAAAWVAEHVADRIELLAAHVGDFFFDEGP